MKNSILGWLYAVPGKKRVYVLILSLMRAVYSASGVIYAVFFKGIADAAANGYNELLSKNIILLILLTAFQLCLRVLIRWFSEYSKATYENIFKLRLTEVIFRKDMIQVSRIHSGEWMNRLTNDAAVVAGGYTEILPGVTAMGVKLISAAVMLFILEKRLAVVIIPLGAVVLILTIVLRKYLKGLHKKVQEADGRLRVFLQERIGGMLLIRSFASEKQVLKESENKADEHKKTRMKKTALSNAANFGFGAVMDGMFITGVAVCGYGIIKGTITLGTLMAVTQLITQIRSPFANITGYLPRYYAMIASAERLNEAESYTEDKSRIIPQDEIMRFYEKELYEIGFENVTFDYGMGHGGSAVSDENDAEEVLNNVSFSIRKGEMTAFTGRSGCGKSTALKLMMCLYRPDSGKRYYSDHNGCRKELTSDFRGLFSYVPQGNMLMSGTIREVVSLACPESMYDSARIDEVLKLACAYDFVSKMDKGYDTFLGEGGAGLSEGQMQRIAIARAIFSHRPVLLLDEATSALDRFTEQQLMSNLRQIKWMTVIIVTHRTETAEKCDKIIEFSKVGAVERSGGNEK